MVERISGDDIAGNKVDMLQGVVNLFNNISFSPSELEELETFEQVLLATMIIKFHLMVSKQKDYGVKNISGLGETGVLNMVENKVARANNLIGNPEQQVEEIKKLLSKLPDDADAGELDKFAWNVQGILAPVNAVKGETMEDTWLDLGNYGDIGYILRNHAWGKPLE